MVNLETTIDPIPICMSLDCGKKPESLEKKTHRNGKTAPLAFSIILGDGRELSREHAVSPQRRVIARPHRSPPPDSSWSRCFLPRTVLLQLD
ncbi:unnamed protein product [Pleuronectes platessa]|uniref:Uncharacterized protein n=1 Tax=Pleuronectes platessa TaxID=8262 RepID=A0A9N7UHX6_PLEPL|nr:unnamed protein product [Pleuronectes platessa]